MKAVVALDGTKLSVTLTTENEAEKVLLRLLDHASPMFLLQEADTAGAVKEVCGVAVVELDKSLRT